MTSMALHTDQYELTMLDTFIADGSVNKHAVFEVFARSLPNGRRYGVVGGTNRLIPMIKDFRFTAADCKWLSENLSLSDDTLEYLGGFKFNGVVSGYEEGEIYFPNSPVLTVEGTLGECVLLETLILSVLNHDSAMATTAARMVSSAKGRGLIEMGSRRTHEESAIAAARAAYIVGFNSTSNLAAGCEYGIPTVGTAAHAFILAHESEAEAFESQIKAQGIGTTLLIDTYDVEQGVRNAVKAMDNTVGITGGQLGAVRIDSGDLAANAKLARTILDEEGFSETRVTVTSDLDEFVIKDLQSAPIDGYGVGTKLVSSNPVGFVYKLVEIDKRPVAKKSKDKVSVGGKKWAYRVLDDAGTMTAERYITHGASQVTGHFRWLQKDFIVHGEETSRDLSIEAAREHHAMVRTELPEGERQVWHGSFGPFLTAEHVA